MKRTITGSGGPGDDVSYLLPDSCHLANNKPWASIIGKRFQLPPNATDDFIARKVFEPVDFDIDRLAKTATNPTGKTLMENSRVFNTMQEQLKKTEEKFANILEQAEKRWATNLKEAEQKWALE
jgi:hypothetical protein